MWIFNARWGFRDHMFSFLLFTMTTLGSEEISSLPTVTGLLTANSRGIRVLCPWVIPESLRWCVCYLSKPSLWIVLGRSCLVIFTIAYYFCDNVIDILNWKPPVQKTGKNNESITQNGKIKEESEGKKGISTRFVSNHLFFFLYIFYNCFTQRMYLL